MMLVGVPVLGLFGILEAGRSLAAPPSVSGDWTVEFDSAANCAGLARLRQPALTISQSGTEARITLNDGRATTLEASINESSLTAKSLTAAITGKAAQRVLEGKVELDGCGPVAFRAVRQAPAKKRGE